jgi:predicted MPP superfamily phosphohydrolase
VKTPPHFLMYAISMILVVGLIHFYLWRRLIKDTKLPNRWKKVSTWSAAALALSLPVGMILTRTISPSLARDVLFVPFLWMGVMVLLFFGTAAVDLVKLIVKIAVRSPKTPTNPSRRLFLSRVAASGIVLTAGSLASAGVVRGKTHPRVHRIKVSLSRFPIALNGLRIVQLTDLHIGGVLDSSWLETVVNNTNRLRPDLIAVTGDLVDGTVSELLPELASLALLRAPLGVFFVTGNHEYYSGAAEWIPAIETLGLRVLRNEHVIIGKEDNAFALVGVDDRNAAKMLKGHGPDVNKALAGIPSGMETVLLAHQPKQIFEAADKDIGLMLSGHTHGGQMWPLTYFVSIQQPYNKGLFLHPGGRTQIYVSQGTGFWGPPMRIGTENEITEITLWREVASRVSTSPSFET